MQHFRWTYRIALVAAFVAFLPSIIIHTVWMVRGQAVTYFMQGRWDLVTINVIIFMFFLILLTYRHKMNWRSKGIYSAFIIALFAEMYGFPLTTYLLVSRIEAVNIPYEPATVFSFNLFGTEFAMSAMMLFGSALTIVGIVLVILGWTHIYKYKGKLVKTGIYSVIRHPQYTGIIFIITGWIVHWPTIPTLLMWPLLVWTYYKLALREEKDLEKAFGKKALKYKAEVPGFI